MKKLATKYEIFVKCHVESLIKKENLNYQIFHQKRYNGKSGRTWDIDVSYTFKSANLDFLVIIECKYWKKKVNANMVSLLKQCLDDCSGHKGAIISTVGFQKGAIKAAQGLGIGLIIIKDKKQEYVSHFDGDAQTFDDLNHDNLPFTENNRMKLAEGTINSENSLFDFITKHIDEKTAENLRNEKYYDILKGSKQVIQERYDKLLDVIKAYEIIETAGLPCIISNEKLVEIEVSLFEAYADSL